MRRRVTAFLLALAVALLTACGGEGGGSPTDVPTDDPEAVVRAHFEARADCGEEATRRLAATTTGPRTGESEEQFAEDLLAEERSEGCTPQPTGEITTILQSQTGEVATVETRIPQGPDAGTYQIRVVLTDEGWKVDTGAGG